MDINQYTKEAVELLQRLIATPSVSREENAAADILADFIEKCGLPVKRNGRENTCEDKAEDGGTGQSDPGSFHGRGFLSVFADCMTGKTVFVTIHCISAFVKRHDGKKGSPAGSGYIRYLTHGRSGIRKKILKLLRLCLIFPRFRSMFSSKDMTALIFLTEKTLQYPP